MNVLLCPLSDPGFLYPVIGVGRELRRRGHAVCALGGTAAGPVVSGAGLAFLPADQYGDARAFGVSRWSDRGGAQYVAVRRAAQQTGADVVVTSVLCHGALVAAEVLDLPVVVVGLATHLWSYRSGGTDEPQLSTPREWRSRETVRYYQLVRDQAGLPARRDAVPVTPLIGSGLLLRGDPALEYPGATLPAGVRHVGPCWWEPPAERARLRALRARVDRVGKPVVYVHLGRTFGGRSLWPRLNAAFTGGPFQAVVELGRSGEPRPAPGADITVVREPWMGPLVDWADLVLTNGTSAPVLWALRSGRPLVVAPAGSEQPLLAAACVRAGVAVRFPDRAGHGESAVLAAAAADPDLGARAAALGARLAGAPGAVRAADLVLSLAGDGGRAAGLEGAR